MSKDIEGYNNSQSEQGKKICTQLMQVIDNNLPEAEKKIWHAHPVWFLEGNPTVGYSKQKAGVRLMFWSGADFGEEKLTPGSGKFKDASVTYADVSEVNTVDIKRWLDKSKNIQWDYKNIVKNKGLLKKL